MNDEFKALHLKIIAESLQDSLRSIARMIEASVPALIPRESAEHLSATLIDAIYKNPFMRPIEELLTLSNVGGSDDSAK